MQHKCKGPIGGQGSKILKTDTEWGPCSCHTGKQALQRGKTENLVQIDLVKLDQNFGSLITGCLFPIYSEKKFPGIR